VHPKYTTERLVCRCGEELPRAEMNRHVCAPIAERALRRAENKIRNAAVAPAEQRDFLKD
jgi:hypothetical protein